LDVRKTDVIYGESIRFALSLTNAGQNPVTIKDTSQENRAFSIHVTASWGFNVWGDQMSIEVREGEHIDQPRDEPRKPLMPGEKWIVHGDVISWIGDLEPGTYALRGHYKDSQGIGAESREIEFKVSEAAPIYARTASLNLPLMLSPRVTAWLHKSAAASDLFVLESSPANPAVTYANVPLAQLEIPANVFPSCYNIAPPTVQHMVWNSADGNLRILRFRTNLPPEAPVAIPLPHEDLEPMTTPFSDEKGNLHVLLATPDGNDAALLQVLGKAAPVFHAVKAVPPLAGPRCALWYRDAVLAFAWADMTDMEATTLFAATVPLNAPPRPISGKSIYTAEHPIVDLVLAQRYNESSDAYDRIVYVLCHNMVDDIFYRWKINLADGAVEEDGSFEVTGAGRFRIHQSYLTDDLTPLYLFAQHDGAVFFADSQFTGFVPVKDSFHGPVKITSHPGIIVPTSFSKVRGVCVRYIDQGKRFAYARIP
jgi:hypothetical protein